MEAPVWVKILARLFEVRSQSKEKRISYSGEPTVKGVKKMARWGS